MLPSTNAFDSALNLQQSEGYNGSLARPTTGVGDATPSQDSEELELQNHSRRASSVSGFEYPCSSTQTSHTPPSPPRSEPDFVFEAAPTTAPHPRDFSLPSARAMTENPAQDGNESLRYIRLRRCGIRILELTNLIDGHSTITTSFSSL